MKRNLLDFYKGMDISSLPEVESDGAKMKDFDGTVMEPFELLKKYGVNSIRLRIWNNPENVKESKGYCDLKHTIFMAKRVKKQGMNFLLDFHYSDFWADPAQQNKPKAWSKLSFEELKKSVFTYTRDTLLSLQSEGVLPDIVQIGNEIRSGLLFPDGELPNYKQMVELVNAGIMGARSVASKDIMQVMIHLDQGGRYFYLKEWFDKSIEAGLMDFDIIGLSYYPFWHGTFMDLKETLEKLINDYNKPIMIVETAHAWRKSEHGFIDDAQEKIAGIEASPSGQKKVLDLVTNIVAALPNNMGMGIYYWEPLCVPKSGMGGWMENMGLLDESGRVMEGIEAFLFEREKTRKDEIAKIYEPMPIKTVIGDCPKLPEKLSVLYYDGRVEKLPVIWQTNNLPKKWFCESGIYNILGKIKDNKKECYITKENSNSLEKKDNLLCQDTMITVEIFTEAQLTKKLCNTDEKAKDNENLVQDSNWEEGLIHWDIEKSKEDVMIQLLPEFIEPFPAPPLNSLRVESPRNFTFSISQQINIAKKGKYTLKVEYMGTDTTNVDVKLFVQVGEEIRETIIHPTEHEYTTYEIKDVLCKSKEVKIGIKVASPPVYAMIRGFEFYIQE